jgi:hypothetical protein
MQGSLVVALAWPTILEERRFIRQEQLREPRPEPQPQFRSHDSTTAPAVMAQSLRNALVLIEKASTRRAGKMERRTDVLPDE